MAKANRNNNVNQSQAPAEASEEIDFSDVEKMKRDKDRANGILPTLFIPFESIELGQKSIDMTTEDYMQFIESNNVQPKEQVWITDEYDRILTTFDGEKLVIHWACRQNLVLRGDFTDIT